jgi:hypothetical protein
VPVDILLAVALALVVILGLFMWIRRSASCARTIEAPAGELDRFFWGGVMCRYVVTSGSLARLELFDWGIRICGTALARWLVPTWEARYEELAGAELVVLRSSRIAVWFRLREEPDAMAFLTERSAEILLLLEERGVPVNRYVARISRLEELYQLPE